MRRPGPAPQALSCHWSPRSPDTLGARGSCQAAEGPGHRVWPLRKGAARFSLEGLLQVGVHVVPGARRAGQRGPQDPSREPAASPRGSGRPGQGVLQQISEAAALAQRHGFQQVVQELGGDGGVDGLARGHERVHLMHALDVASGEALARFRLQLFAPCARGWEKENRTRRGEPGLPRPGPRGRGSPRRCRGAPYPGAGEASAPTAQGRRAGKS